MGRFVNISALMGKEFSSLLRDFARRLPARNWRGCRG
jgi:hypothetical protein